MTRAELPPSATADRPGAALVGLSRAGPRAPDRAERVADAAIHWLGLGLAGLAAPMLVGLAVLWDGRVSVVAGVAVHAAGLLAMLGASAAYHLRHASARRELLRRLDHAAIYLKIAATQTPFALLIGAAPALWALGLVWTCAGAAALARLLRPGGPGRWAVPLYLGLGWAGLAIVWAGGDRGLASLTLGLIVTGGLLYTFGVAFFLAERLRFHTAVWHGFVLAASGVFCAAVAVELGLRAV